MCYVRHNIAGTQKMVRYSGYRRRENARDTGNRGRAKRCYPAKSMTRSKRSHEGEVLIDHRDSPGISEEMVRSTQLPVGAGQGIFEAPTYTCSHCQVVVVLNPKRNRERAWCRYCDHYICDKCGGILAVTKVCKTYTQLLDELQEQASKEMNHG